MSIYQTLTVQMQKQTKPAADDLRVTTDLITRLLEKSEITVEDCLRLAVLAERACIALNKISFGIGGTTAFLGLQEAEKSTSGETGIPATPGNPEDN